MQNINTLTYHRHYQSHQRITGITGPLCAPPQGTDVESRTGDSIKWLI